MAPPPRYSSAVLFLLLLSASAADPPTKSQEFDDMLQSLRNYGYSLFTNALATSDLSYELLVAAAATNFTLFAPRDELLYALDMATGAAVYVSTLRYHVVPKRHTFADLKNLSAPFLDTLLPEYSILIGKFRDVHVSTDRASIGLIVDGVRVAYPDLFVGSRMAVHGIDGILLTGLNLSRDLGADYISPAPALDGNIPAPNPPTSPFIGGNDVSAATVASHFDWDATPPGTKLLERGLMKGRRRYRRRKVLGDL
ncbi:fasciclin-like arabinogalactan protein 19 [Salvia divinorum]|uniref:Fasciclin-like arabinogalactan protein 19 n=1 Tax=Salvia divinorum TaxID=28513 RepID=A0ABD1G9Q1_SALDI